MRKVIVAILLLNVLGLNCLAWAVSPTKPDADRQHSDPLSSDGCQIHLAQIVGESASIKSTAGRVLLARVSMFLDQRPLERIAFPSLRNDCQTLQSQHVLLRI